MSEAPVSQFGPRGGWYAPYRVIHVPRDLNALHGPTAGRVQLPIELDASARATYDVSNPQRRDRMYEIVILEGGSDDDFAAWLDRDALIEAWPVLPLEVEDPADLLQAEAEGPRSSDEPEHLDVPFAVRPISRLRALDRRENAFCLVETDRLGGYPGPPCRLSHRDAGASHEISLTNP